MDACAALITAAGLEDGRFLFRYRDPSNTDELIVSVAFRGKPTHHLLKRAGPGEAFAINNKPTGAKTLEDVRVTVPWGRVWRLVFTRHPR